MVGVERLPVKCKPLQSQWIASDPANTDTDVRSLGDIVQKFLWLLLAIIALFAVSMAVRNRGARNRQSTLRATLDAADLLESEIRATRAVLKSAQLPSGPAEEALDNAMRDLLKQRLWLQSHAATASTESLERVLNGLQEAIRQMRQSSAG